MHEPFSNVCRIYDGDVAAFDARNFGIDLGPLALQVGHTCCRVALGCGNELAQQVEDRDKARLRADELALGETVEPRNRFFGRGRDIEMRLVAVRGIVLSQPGMAVGRPVVEVGLRRSRKGVLALLPTQMKQQVIELCRQFWLRQRALVGRHERAMQEARDERSKR